RRHAEQGGGRLSQDGHGGVQQAAIRRGRGPLPGRGEVHHRPQLGARPDPRRVPGPAARDEALAVGAGRARQNGECPCPLSSTNTIPASSALPGEKKRVISSPPTLRRSAVTPSVGEPTTCGS